MRKYKFRLSESNWIEFSQKDLDNFKNVQFTNDNSTGKIIPIKREFDGNCYQIIAPLEMIEKLTK